MSHRSFYGFGTAMCQLPTSTGPLASLEFFFSLGTLVYIRQSKKNIVGNFVLETEALRVRAFLATRKAVYKFIENDYLLIPPPPHTQSLN